MKTDDFDYELPETYIAQTPAVPRDSCKLMVLGRDGRMEHRVFRDIVDYVRAGDLFVVNETRVLPARLFGRKTTGGRVECLLLDRVQGARADGAEQTWNCMVRPGKRLKPGARIEFRAGDGPCADADTDAGADAVCAGGRFGEGEGGEGPGEKPCGAPLLLGEVVGIDPDNGSRAVRFTLPQGAGAGADAGTGVPAAATKDAGTPGAEARAAAPDVPSVLHELGRTPLPPYIKGYAGDEELYQTVYSKEERSAAAPTAGLHFTEELISRVKAAGARFAQVDLEVGLDTFRLVEEDDPAEHAMHTERYTVPPATARAIAETKAAGGRVIAVGTTSVRSLESAAAATGVVEPCLRASTDLFILPGYEFKVVDAIVTNFHVPRSTLMMLVSAFSGHAHIMEAYEQAKRGGYRFFSFGDAMLLL